jgi:heme oxygenase
LNAPLPGAPVSPLLGELRVATRSAHHRLDHHPLLQVLVRPERGLAPYAQALAALHGPLAALEALLAGLLPEGGFPARRPALEADLGQLGQCPWPLAAPLPCATCDAERLGILYVLEGACLGGAFIARGLAARLPEAPHSFFSSPGPERWARFQQLATRHTGSPAQVIGSALATFTCYQQHLDACLTRQPT